MDIDAAGGAATAGLIGAAIERPTGHAGDAEGNCTDCGLPVGGNFCSNCGQPTHVHRSLLHLVEEVLHGVVHFDGRIWRTLPLLALNPGRLTREWIQGRRTRYVSPLAIFLFSVFLMFFAFSFLGTGSPAMTTTMSAAERAETTEDLTEARAALAEARTALAARPDSNALAVSVRATEATVARLERHLGVPVTVGDAKRGDGLEPGSWQAEVRDAVEAGNITVNLGNKGLNTKVKKKLLNPDLAIYKIQQTLYKFSFLLIPLSIPFVALLFVWKRGFTLYDHGVFVIYSLTAVSILVLLTVVLGRIWGGFGVLGAFLFAFGLPVHMFAQLKGTYGLSIFSALWRTIALMFFCVLASTVFLVAIIMLGLTG
ncbi:MAG: DUF3667 domain-containing protein [Alphaproteobacteria bacterium]|nr:DUF3667 domain-containing protein [Alphaproteobacteria bacterium]MBU1526720.1 DUF3667 domain-containing protein [Alphaproteobacteria bacterium]MBU2117873.1 DUF3667 domain-containing protein [Alphaproteobacteria bacterium]MBU2351002.1 DUF3667 domain-containing protein [Alphaproteobacteria bacterium]MBU2382853.1 DUF3667 domain-containing protein [Alphaproteobacteria bacterium]